MRCPNCHFENPDRFKFCGECGNRLVDVFPEIYSNEKSPPIYSDKVSERQRIEGERRHITVMFCDLVGSTQLSEQLDPEDFRQLLRVYQDTCVYAVNKYQGHLAQYLGDGVLIYFGYPGAHEDDSQRAIHCGLEILNELEQINKFQRRSQGINLTVRIGIHTGLVVVGDVGRDKQYDRLALGNTPNIAARLQALADPNSIIISYVTHRLVKNFFDCQLLGTYSLKGISHKMDIYKVLHESKVPYRFDTKDITDMTPFVGRENEVQKLLRTWENVKKRRGEIVMIIGEPGIGKTRLLHVFEERIKDELHTWLVCSCISYYQNSSFYPIINLINSQLKFEKHDTSTEKLQKLENALSLYDFNLKETVPIIASLLSIPISKPYRPLSLTPQKQKEKTIHVLLRWLIRASHDRPLLFVIEDIHWIDSSTLEHLTLLMEKIDRTQILIILTFHPRFHPPVNEKSRSTEIYLHRLARLQIEDMVREVTGGKNLPAEVIDLLLLKTDGVPLFVEELTKMLLESGYLIEERKEYKLNGSLPKSAIPDTLQDTLMARLDQLGAEKEVVQLAAVIGREFSYELIRAVVPFDESILKKEVNSLLECEILNLQDDPHHSRYVFKQALIQDAAYNSLLKSKRQQYHGKIARIIEKQFREMANNHPQIVAYHYTEAGNFEQAIEYHLKSGRMLVQQSAHREAINQLRKGLRLLEYIDDIRSRDQLELDLQIILGIPLIATKGYGAEEVGKVYERARNLSQKVGDIPQLFPALSGQYRFYLLRGEIRKAFDISELLQSWAQTSTNSDFLLEANRSIGVTLFHMGDIATGLEHLEKGIKEYNPAKHSSHALLYGTDPEVTCLSYGALAQCLLGYTEKAVRYGKRAVQMAKKMNHPFSCAFALNHHTWLYQFLRNTEQVNKFANELISISEEYGFLFWQIIGSFYKGWVLSQGNNVELGIKKMQDGVKSFQASGAGSVLPYLMATIAGIYLKNGQPDKALKWLESADARAQMNDEHFFDAEIHRLKGEAIFISAQKNNKKGELLLWRAVETARRQNLKIFELRALRSLVLHAEKKETINLLRDTYKWFSEGKVTYDLKQAKNLLRSSR